MKNFMNLGLGHFPVLIRKLSRFLDAANLNFKLVLGPAHQRDDDQEDANDEESSASIEQRKDQRTRIVRSLGAHSVLHQDCNTYLHTKGCQKYETKT